MTGEAAARETIKEITIDTALSVPPSPFSAHPVPVPCAGKELWDTDRKNYLSTFYQQFCNIIMMATFTGGVQAAVLAFMNDILSSEAINADLFNPDLADVHHTRYTFYSLGLMLGLLAVALNVGVGAIATVNAALVCHFSISPPEKKPSMEVRVLCCMLIMFVAFVLSGISLILLSIKFDLPFTIVVAVIFFAGIVIAASQFVLRFGQKLFEALLKRRLDALSIIASTAAVIVDLSHPVPSSWYTISAYGFTLLYHIVAVLYDKTAMADRPRRIVACCVTLMALVWVGCVAVAMVWRLQYSEPDRPLRYVLAGLAAVESILLGVISVADWVYIVKALRAGRPLSASEGSQDLEKCLKSGVS